ncbi:MAG: PEP-CTERM sorting domain-containing protein [Bryobacteraceae bacterium]|jgi:hypothetical protein
MTKLSLSLSVLGLLGVASAIPAAADSIDLNTGNGTSPYTITSDTLVPSEGTSVTVVTTTAPLWVNDLSSEWISPQADQSSGNTSGEQDLGSVTYDTTFNLPVGFTNASLDITLAADDWTTISLNGNPVFYTGPDTGEWKFDTILPDSPSVDSELVSGPNTLEFIVYNTGGGSDAGGGPTGLDAQVSVNYSTSAVPEPSTTLPLGLAVLLGGWALQRRRAVA